MVGPSRSRDCATPAELGHDLRPEPTEMPGPEYPHKIERKQVPEDADRYPGYPYEQCRHCGASGHVGSIDPYEECSAQGDQSADRTDTDEARNQEAEA